MTTNLFTRTKNVKAGALILSVLLLITLFAPSRVKAETYAFVTQFIMIDVPDDTIVMTKSTSKYDESWAAAGIDDPEAVLDEFDSMGVVASFHDPKTGLAVNFIYKKTMETVEKFSFADLSDEEILTYMSTVMQATAEDGLNVDLTIRRDLNADVPFFRMVLDARTGDAPCSEVIYGTIVNGQMLQFDSFVEGIGEVDDSFAEQVVRGMRFTKILTVEEYEEEVAKAKVKLALIILAVVAIVAGLICLAVFTRKHREKRAKAISNAMTDFRIRLKDGLIDTSAAPHFAFTTTYDLPLLDEFGVFEAWFNPDPGFVLAIAIFLAFAVFMFSTGHFVYALLLTVLVVVLLYMHYTQAEKSKNALIMRYGVKEKPTAVFKFYDEYFTVSGLTTAGEYIYGQVTKIRSFSHSLFIFTGDSHALIIRKEDLGDTSVRQIRELVYRKNKNK